MKIKRNVLQLLVLAPQVLLLPNYPQKTGQQVMLFDMDNKQVGRISRTESYKGYRVGINGARFFH